MNIFYPYLDKIFEPINNLLGLNQLSVTQYLISVFLIVFILSIIMLTRKGSSHVNNNDLIQNRKHYTITRLIYVMLYLTIVIGMITSYDAYHYSIILIIALIASLITLAATFKYVDTSFMLILSILIIFGINFIFPANGIQEGETTSDMINIYMNGYFRWSVHAPWYDMAPVDAITKVIMAYVFNTSIFDPISGTFLYVLIGASTFLFVYSSLKEVAREKPSIIIPLMILTMTAYPYSPLLGLTTATESLYEMMGYIIYAYVVVKVLLLNDAQIKHMIIIIPFLIYAILASPVSLGLIAVLIVTLIVVYISKELRLQRSIRIIEFLILITVILYLVKAVYTAFASSFTTILSNYWSLILDAFRSNNSILVVTTSNVGYSSLPRLSITGFAVFLAVVAAYSLIVFLRILSSLIKKRKIEFIDLLFIAITILYISFAIAAYLTGVGGASQSKTFFTAVEPYMEFMLILHALLNAAKSRSSGLNPVRFSFLIGLLLLASLSSLMTPNALPLNYAIPLGSKPATLNDHIIAYTFMGLVSKKLFINLYNSYGELGRIAAVQERSNFSYGLGSTMAVVYYYIAPRVVNAKSYWDYRIGVIFNTPKDSNNYVADKVFDAWVYGFYLYIRIK